MSKAALAVLATVAAAAGGYTVLWHTKANDFKARFTETVADINQQTKPLLKDGEMIRYESVDVSGFPMAMTLNMKKPSIRIPISELLRLASKDKAKWEVPAGFEWTDDMAYADGISLGSDVMGTKFTLTLNGDRSDISTVNGKQHFAVTSASKTPLVCTLETRSAGFLKASETFKDVDTLANAVQAASCNVNGVEVKDASTGAQMLTMDKMDFFFRNVANNGNRSFAVKLNSGATRYTQAFDVFFENVVKVMSEAQGGNKIRVPYSFAEFGDSTVNIDVAYEGPDAVNAFASKDANMQLDVTAFNFNSALFNSNTTLNISLNPKDQGRKLLAKINSKTNISERYDQFLAAQSKDTIAELVNTEGKTGKDLEVAKAVAALGTPDALVDTFLPRFHRLGDMVLNLDLDVDSPDASAPMEGTTKIHALDILTTPYGIKSKVDVTVPKGNAPSGSGEVFCLNCDSMIDDIGGYMIRSTQFFKAKNPGDESEPYTKELFDGIKRFVRSIAENGADANAKDLKLTVSGSPMGNFSVSGKPFMEVAQSFTTNVSPFLPKPKTPKNPQIPPMMMDPQQMQPE